MNARRDGCGAGDAGDAPAAASMRVLVSVRDTGEALQAAAAGADLIDLKEPRAGALGGLPPATIRAVVQALRNAGHGVPVSATIGDLAMDCDDEIVARVAAVGACGVDYVKVGIAPHPRTAACLHTLLQGPWPVVPVLLADRGIDAALLRQACAGAPPALMLDLADKNDGSLLRRLSAAALGAFVAAARSGGALAGLAGALRIDDVAALQRIGPDFAGFRGAVCGGGTRTDAIDARRLRALLAARDGLREPTPVSA